MATKILLKRGISADFSSATLDRGEPAFLTDLGKLYIGDGSNKVLINPIDKPVGISTSGFFTKVRVNEYGQVVDTQNVTASDLPPIPLDKIVGLGDVVTHNIGVGKGEIPVLGDDGKLSDSVIPDIAISSVFKAGSDDEMLALVAQVGDICVRTDLSRSYALRETPSEKIENWQELLTPSDRIQSVNGQIGNVLLGGNNLELTGFTNTSKYSPILATDTINTAVGKLEHNFLSYAPLQSPALVGTPTAPTPDILDNSTRVATTAYVTQILTIIDGGTF